MSLDQTPLCANLSGQTIIYYIVFIFKVIVVGKFWDRWKQSSLNWFVMWVRLDIFVRTAHPDTLVQGEIVKHEK